MTTVYFIRHAESDMSVRDAASRPLTPKGMADRRLVTEFLRDKDIHTMLSSPYKRAVDTVSPFAAESGLEIETIDGFRERISGGDSERCGDFYAYIERLWADFSYSLPGGECLACAQARNIAALNGALERFKDKNIVIGTHGTALSTIINYYYRPYGYADFLAMEKKMPWAVTMFFDGFNFAGIRFTDLFGRDTSQSAMNRADYAARENLRFIVNTAALGEYKAYRFVVVFARYRDKWLYCRSKSRDVFETVGGHIEEGETPLAAARRELYEESGATAFDIEPAFDYSVRVPESFAHGQVFFAKIHELGDMPGFEMAETGLFDSYPENSRFPQILPVLYDQTQYWLNLQSAKDEIWDVYDSERRPKGRTHRRADPLAPGDYHLVVYAWLLNSRGEYLITKRSPNKGFPGLWECTGGSAVSGDDSLAAAVREVKEEIGLDVDPKNGAVVHTSVGHGAIGDTWLFRQDFDLRDVKLQENETSDAKYATADEIRRMIKIGEFCEFESVDSVFAASAP